MNNVPIPNWHKRVDIDIACELLGDGWLAFVKECLEKVDPNGEDLLSSAKKMYAASGDK